MAGSCNVMLPEVEPTKTMLIIYPLEYYPSLS
jgi:hypothetical protein